VIYESSMDRPTLFLGSFGDLWRDADDVKLDAHAPYYENFQKYAIKILEKIE
jgi:hypothetical protein